MILNVSRLLTSTEKTTTRSNLKLDSMTEQSSQVANFKNTGKCNINIMNIDGVSLDGTILHNTHTFEIELVVIFDVLATLGIAFALVCFIFNFGFRNRK